MENQKIKKEENQKEEIKIKLSQELSINEIKALEKLPVVITTKMTEDKDFGGFKHSNPIIQVKLSQHCTVDLRQDYKSQFNNYPLTVKEFILLKSKMQLGDKVNCIKHKFPVRFLKGINKNGKEYYRIDIILPGMIVKSIYLQQVDLDLLNLDPVNYNWELIPTKLDLDFNEEFEDLLIN